MFIICTELKMPKPGNVRYGATQETLLKMFVKDDIKVTLKVLKQMVVKYFLNLRHASFLACCGLLKMFEAHKCKYISVC